VNNGRHFGQRRDNRPSTFSRHSQSDVEYATPIEHHVAQRKASRVTTSLILIAIALALFAAFAFPTGALFP